MLSEAQVNRHLAVTVVQTKDVVVRYNDTFSGKQLKVYGAPSLFEQFFQGKAMDRIWMSLNMKSLKSYKRSVSE